MVFLQFPEEVAIGFSSKIKNFQNTASGHVTEVPICRLPKYSFLPKILTL